MSLESSSAIVLRVYPWSETSLVVTLYTREFGKLGMLAKGARRPRSPFEAALDLISVCRVVFIAKSSDALDILTEAKLERRFRAGSWDVLRLNCGFYAIELLDRLTDIGDRQPEIYDLANESLIALEDPSSEPGAIVLRLELGLLRITGNLPSWQVCVRCGRELPSSEWVTLSVTAGGVLCPRCQPGARDTLRIHASVQNLMRRFSHPDWRRIPIKQDEQARNTIASYPTQHRAAIRALVTRYLTSLLDRPLHLHAFLEELGR